MIRRLFILCSFALFVMMLAVSLDRYFHHQHTAFSPRHVKASNLLSSQFQEPPLSYEESEGLFNILSQKFTLYHKGIHSHAFISEDGCYVLHFLAQQHVVARSYFDHLPIIHTASSKKFHEAQRHWETILSAWQMAAVHLKQETGLIYAHLSKRAPLHKRVLLIDQKLEPYWVDLNKTVFYLQRHPSLFYLRLHELVKLGDLQTAKQVISSVFSLASRLLKQGCLDASLFEIGLIDDLAIQTNVSVLPAVAKGDVREATASLRQWVQEYAPVLLDHFDRQLTATEYDVCQT